MNSEGVRDMYLPAGDWVDFWTGETLESEGRWLKGIRSPLARLPLYVKKGSCVKMYPEAVECTDGMDLSKAVEIVFDASYKGLGATCISRFIKL